jgi:molybdate transport system permease protein
MSNASIWLSVELAVYTTVVLLLIGLPLSWALSHSRWRLKMLVEVLITLPLILPPTVLGFYILQAFSPNNALGHFLDSTLDLRIVFTFPGLVLASVIYSLPFMVSPLQSGFSALPSSLCEAAYSLGKSRFETFWRVELPNIKPQLMSAIVLTFAHTLGEFGVVLMVGGNVEGQTRTASIVLYNEVSTMNYANAQLLAAKLTGISFALLLVFYFFMRKRPQIL